MIASKQRRSCPPGVILLLSAKSGDVAQTSALLRSGRLDPDATRDARGNTALHIAAVHGRANIARLLVAAGASTESVTPGERLTPLRLAVERGDLLTAQALLDAGADVAAQDFVDRATPLHAAAEAGHASVVLELVRRGADLEARAVSGQTPLRWALSFGRAEAARALLGAGADPDAPDRRGACCLHAVAAFRPEEGRGVGVGVSGVGVAAAAGSSSWPPVAMAELLLSAGATPDFCCSVLRRRYCRRSPSRSLSTPAAAAAAAAVSLVVGVPQRQQQQQGRTNNNMERDDGNHGRGAGEGGGRGTGGGGGVFCPIVAETPLHVAARESSVEVARVLLRSGANPNARTSSTEGGLSPLHCAAAPGDDRRRAIVRLLLHAGADIDANCSDGITTPLRLACQNSAVACVEELLRWGANDDNDTVSRFPFSSCATPSSSQPSSASSACSALSTRSVEASASSSSASASATAPSEPPPPGGGGVLPVSPPSLSLFSSASGSDNGGIIVQQHPPSSLRRRPHHHVIASARKPAPLEDLIGTRVPASARDPVDDKQIRELLRKAPADRAWRRRGWLVMFYHHVRGHPVSPRARGVVSVSEEEEEPAGVRVGDDGRGTKGARIVETLLRPELSSGYCWAGFSRGIKSATGVDEGGRRRLGGFAAGGAKEACFYNWAQQQVKPSRLHLTSSHYQKVFLAIGNPGDDCGGESTLSSPPWQRHLVKRKHSTEILTRWEPSMSSSCRLRGEAPTVPETKNFKAFATDKGGLRSSGKCPGSEKKKKNEIEMLSEVVGRLFEIQGDQSIFRRVVKWL